jgi:uncharacterized protein (TIGR03790 family)
MPSNHQVMRSFDLRLILWLAMLSGLMLPGVARAGGSEVVVVYNSAVPESKTVAEYYASARQVPRNQVFGFKLPKGLEMTRSEFRTRLQEPLADQLESRDLWKFGDVTEPAFNGRPAHTEHRVVASKIRYLVLCYGVPLRIQEDPTLQEDGATNVPAQLRSNTAAVDSELAWLPVIRMHVLLSGPLHNWVYGATNEWVMNPTNGILPVTRLDGPTPQIACGLVDKAMAAERDGLWGRAYFDTRGLAKTDHLYYGDYLMLGAAEVCAGLGFDTIIDTNAATFAADYPLSSIAVYCGWYDADVSGPFTLPQVEFMPGAFAYHLHSFSAADVRSLSNNWVGPLLAKGATCTMGCVNEPFLSNTPDVAFFLRALAQGWTFGEAAWAAQPVLSWQTTVVGDPLYRPFARQPLQWYFDLQKRHSPYLEWSFLRLLNLDREHGAPIGKLAGVLDQVPETSQSAVLTEKLADLTWALGKPSSAIDYYERALNLNPSRQQRIRLRLTLGTKLAAENRMAEACDNYRRLLAEVPDYAGKTNLEATLTRLEPQPAKPAAR